MRRLTITLTGLVGIIFIAVLGLPLGTGFWLKSHYQNLLNKFTNEPGISVQLVSFKRGWFTSRARLKVSLQSHWLLHLNETHDKNVATFYINQTITNGPIIVSKLGNESYNIIFARALVVNHSSTAGLTFNSHTIWTFNNHLKTALRSDQLVLSNQQQLIKLSGLIGTISYDLDQHKIQTQFAVNSASMSIKEKKEPLPEQILQLNNLQSEADFNKKGSLWYGTRKISIGELTAFPMQSNAFMVKDITAMTHQTQENQHTNINIKYHTDSLRSHDFKFGPMGLDVSLNALNTDALKQLVQKSYEEHDQIAAAHTNNAFQTLIPSFANLIGKGLVVSLSKFTLSTLQGPVSLSAKVTIPQQPAQPSLNYILAHSQATVSLEAPKTWVITQITHFYNDKQLGTAASAFVTPNELATLMVTEWLKNGTLIASGSDIKLHASYKNGQLLFNGKTPSVFPALALEPLAKHMEQSMAHSLFTKDINHHAASLQKKADMMAPDDFLTPPLEPQRPKQQPQAPKEKEKTKPQRQAPTQQPDQPKGQQQPAPKHHRKPSQSHSSAAPSHHYNKRTSHRSAKYIPQPKKQLSIDSRFREPTNSPQYSINSPGPQNMLLPPPQTATENE